MPTAGDREGQGRGEAGGFRWRSQAGEADGRSDGFGGGGDGGDVQSSAPRRAQLMTRARCVGDKRHGAQCSPDEFADFRED